MKMITHQTIQALTAADMAGQGCWPVVGGWLDQSKTALDLVTFVNGENATLEAFKEQQIDG